MASVTKLFFLLSTVTVLIAIFFPAETIQHYRLQLQQFSTELYENRRQANEEISFHDKVMKEIGGR